MHGLPQLPPGEQIKHEETNKQINTCIAWALHLVSRSQPGGSRGLLKGCCLAMRRTWCAAWAFSGRYVTPLSARPPAQSQETKQTGARMPHRPCSPVKNK